MTIAIWIIAICEVVRALQNMIQISVLLQDASARDSAYSEFVKSIKYSDKEVFERTLKEFEDDTTRQA